MRVNDFGIGLIGLLEKNGNYDMERIGKALDFATAAHDGQFRKSGEPYITHPIHVAKILASYESDSDAIIAALLRSPHTRRGKNRRSEEIGGIVALRRSRTGRVACRGTLR